MDIINAKIMTMEEVDYENGYVTVQDGMIAAAGDMSAYTPSGGEVVDAAGGAAAARIH